jgi:hypothetical protein
MVGLGQDDPATEDAGKVPALPLIDDLLTAPGNTPRQIAESTAQEKSGR